jgi:hypothetical protein
VTAGARCGLEFFDFTDLTDPSQLFGANTFTTASNPKQLLPESITTTSVGIEELLSRYLDHRPNCRSSASWGA